jgi:hypothetical protein
MLLDLPIKILWLKSPMPLRLVGDINGLTIGYYHELLEGLKGAMS